LPAVCGRALSRALGRRNLISGCPGSNRRQIGSSGRMRGGRAPWTPMSINAILCFETRARCSECCEGDLMFFDDAPPHASGFETPESNLRFRMMVAEFLHDWFEVMSQVAYQTHRACEFFVQDGGPLNRQYGPHGFRSWRGPAEASNHPID